MPQLESQPELNIGTLGHVDHGKTTLVQAITGVWAAKHSEELRRGITIKLGYADAEIRRCPNCSAPECYTTLRECPHHKTKTEFLRAVSFVDAPGHELLMTTTLAGTVVMDGALFVIAADEKCPQPQTREHLVAAEIAGVKDVIVAQNKIDVVSREDAIKSYREISEFAEGTILGGAPIIPVSAQHGANVDLLIEAIENYLPTPKRDPSKPPIMPVIRSFDANRPGTPGDKIIGGVIGGSLVQGVFRVDDEIEIRPGAYVESAGSYEPLATMISSLRAGGRGVEEARPGGLIGVGTLLDPSLTKGDGLVGNIAGKPDMLPDVRDELTIEYHLLKHVVGTQEIIKAEPITKGETLVLNVGAARSQGNTVSVTRDLIEVKLSTPVCAEVGSRVAISRRILGRWRLVGYGSIA
ncbi:MAG: translation initiation factor IF-2 subunit gamma [Candidatus Bathyarchaeia archaeon]